MNRESAGSRTRRLCGLALLVALCACEPAAERVVVLVSLDTLRADHLGRYGYGRDTSPNLDAFAGDDAVTFEAAFAQAPYTLPSHMSIMTGLYPEAHGVLLPGAVSEDGVARTTRLSDEITTLAEILAADGFATTAFTDGLLVDGRYGFDRGFDEYRDLHVEQDDGNGFRKFRAELHAWIRDHSARSFFLFVHTYDTHSPYAAPEPFRSRFDGAVPGREHPTSSLVHASMLRLHSPMYLHQYRSMKNLIDAYDGCVAYVDHEVGELFDLLKRKGLWDRALVIVTSDHGELFLENSLVIGHGFGSYEEEIHIPLLIKFPGSPHAGRRIDHVVESIDILPTILSALEIPIPGHVQGQDLLAGLERGRWAKDHVFGISPHSGYNHYLRKDGYKFIETVYDPWGERVRRSFRPKTVEAMVPPPVDGLEAGHDLEAWEKLFYYDVRLDPIGLLEAFHRGDRLYDLRKAEFEWQTQEIDDPERLWEFKSEAYRLAAESADLGRSFAGNARLDVGLSDDDVASLEALGYLILDEPAETSPVKRMSEGGASPPEIRTRPPLVDRTRLHRGDHHLWEILRYREWRPSNALPEYFARYVDAARSHYEAFLAEHPDRNLWVYWRLAMLDEAAAEIRGESHR